MFCRDTTCRECPFERGGFCALKSPADWIYRTEQEEQTYEGR